jgi:hypothetical protein
MKSLGFAVVAERENGARAKRVRSAQFEPRSSLPVSATCVVANAVRETLSALLGTSVRLRLFEPSIPSPQAWTAILEDARLYRSRGRVADAAIVLRVPDAATLSAALFGESHAGPARDLSPIECDVVDRMIAAVAANLAAVCGKREESSLERVGTIAGFVTYFELSVEEPVSARIGIALSRDPAPERGASLDVAHLAGIRLAAKAVIDLGTAEAAAVARIAVGTMLPISDAALRSCALTTHRRRLAGGSCGVQRAQYAFFVEAT